tara:strand:- start:1000 stop:1269 length:270 start_codon:yes stop_codon:yes gene_type:complete
VPKYCYFCKSCEEYFDLIHSYKKKINDCILCDSKETVTKFLGQPINLDKKKIIGKIPVGKVVTDTIEEIKQEIKTERKTERKSFKVKKK